MHRILAAVLAVSLLLVLPLGAWAAEDAPTLALELGAGALGAADFSDRDGGCSVVRAKATAAYGVAALSYDLRSFDWDDAADLPLGDGVSDPWDELHSVELSAGGDEPLEGEWGWYWLAGAGAAWEEEMDDSAFVALGLGLTRSLGPDWALRLGALATAHRIRWNLLPMGAVLWRPGAEQGASAVLGAPESSLAWRFDAEWAVRLALGWEGGVWRLADDSPVERRGYVSMTGFKAGLYGEWTSEQGLFLRFGPELAFSRRVEIYDEDGERENAYGLDSALGGSLDLGWRF